MIRGRLAKTLARSAMVSWRDEPTQYDIEALRGNIERVGLIIRVRWAIVIALSVFSVVASIVYAPSTQLSEYLANMRVPSLALAFVVIYNSMYQMTYRRIGNIAFLNQAQLLFDMAVVTVLVYYSGGVYSWFSAMYLLFILEGAFILPRRAHVWMLAVAAGIMYGIVIFGDLWGWFPHVGLPFVEPGLNKNVTYVMVRYLWKVTLYGGAATIGLLMMKSIREREAELRESSFIDDLTGLFNRQYFQRVLATEIDRARRNNRSVALMLLDLDNFGEVNRRFGVDVGDALLSDIGSQLKIAAVSGVGGTKCDVCVACRVGGEEMAIVVPEVAGLDDRGASLEEHMLMLAEGFRTSVERTRVDGVGVTASIGLAIGPRDGDSVDALLDAADTLLSAAAAAGGNAVRASWLTSEQPVEADA